MPDMRMPPTMTNAMFRSCELFAVKHENQKSIKTNTKIIITKQCFKNYNKPSMEFTGIIKFTITLLVLLLHITLSIHLPY